MELPPCVYSNRWGGLPIPDFEVLSGFTSYRIGADSIKVFYHAHNGTCCTSRPASFGPAFPGVGVHVAMHNSKSPASSVGGGVHSSKAPYDCNS